MTTAIASDRRDRGEIVVGSGAIVSPTDPLAAAAIMRRLDARGAWSAASMASAYETTLRAISKMQVVHNELANHEAARHPKLSVYGHMVGDVPRMGKVSDVRAPEAGISGAAATSRSTRGRRGVLHVTSRSRPFSTS